VRPVLRRLQFGPGVVLLIYLFLHRANHALGIWSLDITGRGPRLAVRPGIAYPEQSCCTTRPPSVLHWLCTHSMMGTPVCRMATPSGEAQSSFTAHTPCGGEPACRFALWLRTGP
jgi:hypothetical protein